MAQVISVFLQGAGVLLLIWLLLSWLILGQDRGGVCVRICPEGSFRDAEAFLRSCIWLRETGLTRMKIVLTDCGLDPEERAALERRTGGRVDLLLCRPEELMDLLKREANDDGRSGAAAGNCGRSNIPES